jgi:hypothetical protein
MQKNLKKKTVLKIVLIFISIVANFSGHLSLHKIKKFETQ